MPTTYEIVLECGHGYRLHVPVPVSGFMWCPKCKAIMECSDSNKRST